MLINIIFLTWKYFDFLKQKKNFFVINIILKSLPRKKSEISYPLCAMKIINYSTFSFFEWQCVYISKINFCVLSVLVLISCCCFFKMHLSKSLKFLRRKDPNKNQIICTNLVRIYLNYQNESRNKSFISNATMFWNLWASEKCYSDIIF